jgi:hypothetical protein
MDRRFSCGDVFCAKDTSAKGGGIVLKRGQQPRSPEQVKRLANKVL